MIEREALKRIAGLLGAEPAEVRVRPLSGGLSNRSFLLRCGSDRWAVRLPVASGTGNRFRAGNTLGPEIERQVLAVAADAGLTPEIVTHDVETGALITRYLRGAQALKARQVRDHANIDRIAAQLRRLHSLPVPAGVSAFRPTRLARRYVEACRAPPGASHKLLTERRRWGREFRQLALRFEAAFEPTVLCHNDLVAANVLDDGHLWLVDFEYAVRADPVLDLAGLAGLNGFGPEPARRLLQAYHGRAPDNASIAQLDQVIRLVRLMAYFWALAHRGGEQANELKRFAAAMAAVLR